MGGGSQRREAGPVSSLFNPDWDLARVVSRGAESIHVESKISINALTLRIR